MNYFEAALFLGFFFLSPPWAGAHDMQEGAVNAAASGEVMCFLRKVFQPFVAPGYKSAWRDVQAGCLSWWI